MDKESEVLGKALHNIIIFLSLYLVINNGSLEQTFHLIFDLGGGFPAILVLVLGIDIGFDVDALRLVAVVGDNRTRGWFGSDFLRWDEFWR